MLTGLQIPKIIKEEDLIQDELGQFWFQLPNVLPLVTQENSLLTSEEREEIKFPILISQEHTIALYDKFPIGIGAFGRVYVGQDLNTGTFYAVKEHSFKTEQEIQEATAEVNVLGAQGELVDVICTENGIYLVMPLAPGKDYHQTLFKSPSDTSPNAFLNKLEMAIQAVQAVKEYNELGYLHRDLKLDNIMWDPIENQAKLVDKAKSIYVGDTTDKSYLANAGDGTMQYMAPEICHSPAIFSLQSEKYALGIIVLEILSGHVFKGDPMQAMVHYLKNKSPEAEIASFIKEAFPSVFSGNTFGAMQKYIEILGTAMLRQDPIKRPSYEKILKLLNFIRKKHSQEVELQFAPVILTFSKMHLGQSVDILAMTDEMPLSLTNHETKVDAKNHAGLFSL